MNRGDELDEFTRPKKGRVAGFAKSFGDVMRNVFRNNEKARKALAPPVRRDRSATKRNAPPPPPPLDLSRYATSNQRINITHESREHFGEKGFPTYPAQRVEYMTGKEHETLFNAMNVPNQSLDFENGRITELELAKEPVSHDPTSQRNPGTLRIAMSDPEARRVLHSAAPYLSDMQLNALVEEHGPHSKLKFRGTTRTLEVHNPKVVHAPLMAKDTLEKWQKDPRTHRYEMSFEASNVSTPQVRSIVENTFEKWRTALGIDKIPMVGVLHRDTDNVHAHILTRELRKGGRFGPEVGSDGMKLMRRIMAQEATKVIGPRRRQDMEKSWDKQTIAMRVTELDLHIARHGSFDHDRLTGHHQARATWLIARGVLRKDRDGSVEVNRDFLDRIRDSVAGRNGVRDRAGHDRDRNDKDERTLAR